VGRLVVGKVSIALVAVCLLLVPALAVGGELATLNLGENASCWGPVFVHYVPSLTTIINEPVPNEGGFKEIRVAKLRLSQRSTDTLIINYTEGPSCDPAFIVYRIEKCGPRQLDWAIDGLDLEVPGDGYFYVRGHTDSWSDMCRKFTVEGGNLREVKQPFHYIGLETKTLKQIHLYSNQGCTEMMSGWIEAGSPITVVLSDGGTFLIKTDHDVLGWWRPQNPSNQKATEIEGLFFRGD
jgi:hypothetical protein